MMMKDTCKKQSALPHQEQSRYLGHTHGPEPLALISSLLQGHVPGCAGGGNRLEKHSAIAEMCTLELLTASGRTAAGEETAGMLLFIASIIVQIVLASLSSHVSFSPFQTGLCF